MRKLFLVIMAIFLLFVLDSSFLSAYEKEVRSISSALAENIAKAGKKMIAVVDFTDLQGNVTELGRFLAEEFSIAFAGSDKGFEVVDRTHLKSILAEHKLSASGILDPQTAKKLGQIAGVDALITGAITPFGDSIRISVKVLDTSTARIIGASSGDIAKTKAIEELLAREVEAAEPVRQDTTKHNSSDNIVIECWGSDLTDGNIGGWKSSYPHCILDDGGGAANAIYDGVMSLERNKICMDIGNLSTAAPPSHQLAVGFRITLKKRSFPDGSKSKIIEMTTFSGRPSNQMVQKCLDFRAQ